jgi:hypothetical protein
MPEIVAEFTADLWTVDTTDDPAGIEIYMADQTTGKAVIVRLSGYFARPDGQGGFTTHARADDFAMEVAAACGIAIE